MVATERGGVKEPQPIKQMQSPCPAAELRRVRRGEFHDPDTNRHHAYRARPDIHVHSFRPFVPFHNGGQQ
jgi:hypothetical protein